MKDFVYNGFRYFIGDVWLGSPSCIFYGIYKKHFPTQREIFKFSSYDDALLFWDSSISPLSSFVPSHSSTIIEIRENAEFEFFFSQNSILNPSLFTIKKQSKEILFTSSASYREILSSFNSLKNNLLPQQKEKQMEFDFL